MLCQECQKRKATVYLTKIINGYKTEMHLCEVCVQGKSDLDLSFDFEPKFSIQDLLTGILNFENVGGAPGVGYPRKLQCPNCGLTFAQFGQIGRFGCSECYNSFDSRLESLMKRIHGSQTHSGKVPRRVGGTMRLQRELERLRKELQQHVDREEFEKAALLRDEIRKLEKKLGKGKSDG
ncbi:MAG: UvrB/UvrC motif-containing protein [Dethiobacteria bacterium]|jgi:protein arginine kinase activator|nr:hypothetical protein [Bacillota bacterium]